MRDRLWALLLAFAALGPVHAQGDAKRGEYLASAGGCLGCHTEAKEGAVPYAGGPGALHTPFGTFYGPNLTPHPVAGLGRWSEADFARAMRQGVRPDGAHYFPAFVRAAGRARHLSTVLTKSSDWCGTRIAPTT